MIRMSPYDRRCPGKNSPSFEIEGRPPQGTVTTLKTDTVHEGEVQRRRKNAITLT